METKEWCLAINGLSTHRDGGARIVLYDPNGTNVYLSFELKISCSNKENEYESLVIGLISVLHMKIQRLRVQGDLRLIIQ